MPAQTYTIAPSPEQCETGLMLAAQEFEKLELWLDETDSTMGAQYTDDGLIMTGYFGRDGELVGDWF